MLKIDGWTCHVCGTYRPDERISVRSSRQELSGGVVVQHNVRYCNDREECVLGSYERLAGFERRLGGETLEEELLRRNEHGTTLAL